MFCGAFGTPTREGFIDRGTKGVVSITTKESTVGARGAVPAVTVETGEGE